MTGSLDTNLSKVLAKRFEILHTLNEQPQRKPELVESVDCSRSTVDRAITELLQYDCVESHNREYRTTPLGRASLNIRQEYLDKIHDVQRASDILNENPNLKELPSVFLRQVTVSTADPQFPESALSSSTARLRQSERMVGLAPVVLKSYIDDVEAAVRETQCTAEIIVSEDVLPELVDYRESFTELVDSGRVVLLVTGDELPYALWIMEGVDGEVAGITVHQHGGVRGMLTNTAPEAVKWAREQYESFKADATRYQLAEN
ncbi:winged helix-turn-helix domain-containing protein [Haloferax sp. KTX1]|uniref:helix-turn-helix transcriptional regulator n=1 Tax=Haloferax sp. KTX1 TaxID=2600597 RepID=UPI0011DDDADF|nr:hypothetical protein [Haloferax sp. KTX1]